MKKIYVFKEKNNNQLLFFYRNNKEWLYFENHFDYEKFLNGRGERMYPYFKITNKKQVLKELLRLNAKYDLIYIPIGELNNICNNFVKYDSQGVNLAICYLSDIGFNCDSYLKTINSINNDNENFDEINLNARDNLLKDIGIYELMMEKFDKFYNSLMDGIF